jgi:hypothetical protein
MFFSSKAVPEKEETYAGMFSLYNILVRFSFFNLLVVSLLGLLLRSFPFLSGFALEYKNVLHGHSHFAFGGWIMPVLLALFLRSFPEIAERVDYRHWRNITVLILASAYGMLFSFPVQGYKALSIFFSTSSVAAGYYMVFVIRKAMKGMELKASHRFIKWGLIYFAVSAIGPFATGPLIAMGRQGTPLYYDVIYFYLHFQYNGLFTFFVLAFLYKMLEKKQSARHGQKVFTLFNFACIPTYALSVLWNQPPVVLNIIGGAGASLQVIGLTYLVKDIKRIRWAKSWITGLLFVSLFAFVLKIVLQLFSAWPSIAYMAYQHRNFVIAYLHLVLLGFISVFFFAQLFSSFSNAKTVRQGVAFFLASFISTELLLIANAFSLFIPFYTQWLLAFSVFFPIGILWINAGLRKNLYNSIPLR